MRHGYGQISREGIPGPPPPEAGPVENLPGFEVPREPATPGYLDEPRPEAPAPPEPGDQPNGAPPPNGGMTPPPGQPGQPVPGTGPQDGQWPTELGTALRQNVTKVAVAGALLIGTGVVIGYFIGKGQAEP